MCVKENHLKYSYSFGDIMQCIVEISILKKYIGRGGSKETALTYPKYKVFKEKFKPQKF